MTRKVLAYVPGAPEQPTKPTTQKSWCCEKPDAERQPDLGESGATSVPEAGGGGQAPADRREFESACMPQYEYLRRLARRLTHPHSEESAMDILHETMIRAMRHWSKFRPGTSVRAWLSKIMTNLVIDEHHSKRRAREVYASYAIDVATSLTKPPLEIERAAVRSIVEAAVERLSAVHRVVVQREMRGETYREIADAVGIPFGTVMSRLFRARIVLEESLRAAEVDIGYAPPPGRRRRSSRTSKTTATTAAREQRSRAPDEADER